MAATTNFYTASAVLPQRVRRRPQSVSLAIAVLLFLATFGLLWMPNAVSRDGAYCGVAMVLILMAAVQFHKSWCLALLLLPLLQLEVMPFRLSAALTLPRGIFLGFLIVFVATQRRRSQLWQGLRRSYGFIGLVLFLVASVLSALYARSFDSVWRALTYLEPVLVYLLSYYVVLSRPEQHRVLLKVLCIATILVFLLGVAEIVMQQSPLLLAGLRQADDPTLQFEAEDRVGLGRRLALVIGHPVFAGIYIILAGISAIYYFRVYQPGKTKIATLIILPVASFLLIATGTRGALIGACAAGLTSAVVSRQRVKALFAMAIGGTIILFASYTLVPQLWTYLAKSMNFSQDQIEAANVIGRVNLTETLLAVFQEHPWFGLGPGTVQHQAFDGFVEFTRMSGMENQYATILADSGIFGGAAYLFFMIGAMVDGISMLRSPSRTVNAGGSTLLLMLAGYFTFAVSATAISILPAWILLAVYGAIDASRRAIGRPESIVYTTPSQ